MPKFLLPTGIDCMSCVDPKGEWIFPKKQNISLKIKSLPNRCLIQGKVVLYLHGGAFCLCNTSTHRGILSTLVKYSGAVALAVEYRRPPENPFPQPVEDCVLAYQWLLQSFNPSDIIFVGDSAGGSLVVSTIIAAQKQGLPPPKGGILISPWVDLEDHGSGLPSESWTKNLGVDYLPHNLASLFAVSYLGENTWEDVSPTLSKNLNLLPPLLIEVGECEVLLDQVLEFVSKCRTAGVEVTVNVREDMVHVFPLFIFTGMTQCKLSFQDMAAFILNA